MSVIEQVVWLCEAHEHYGNTPSQVLQNRGNGFCYWCLGDGVVYPRTVEMWGE